MEGFYKQDYRFRANPLVRAKMYEYSDDTNSLRLYFQWIGKWPAQGVIGG